MIIFKLCPMLQIQIDIGNRIRQIRKTKNLTQQQLANLADAELSTINRIELGKANPRLSSMIAISAGLEVSLYDIFEGTEMEYFFDTAFFRTPAHLI